MRWMLAAVSLLGCGSPSGATDAPAGGDAAIDAHAFPPPDAWTGGADPLCTPAGAGGLVTVRGPGTAYPGDMTVVVSDPAGAFVSRSAVFHEGGSVQVTVPSCGMVTVHRASGQLLNDLVTWTGVQAGDVLVDLRKGALPATFPVHVTVPAVPGSSQYTVEVACAGGGGSASSAAAGELDVDAHCAPTAASATVLARTTTGTSHFYSLVSDVALGSTTTLTVDPPSLPTQIMQVTLANTSGYVGALAGAASLAGPTAGLAVHYASVDAAVTGGFVAFPELDATSLLAIVQVGLNASGPGGGIQQTRLVRGLANVPGVLPLDAATDLLPLVDATIAADATHARPIVTWSASASSPSARSFALIVAGVGNAGQWSLIRPPTPGPAQFPALPADLLTPGNQVLQLVSVYDDAALPTYAAARAGAAGVDDPPNGGTAQRVAAVLPSSL